jgi:hypothetical protein
VWEGESPPHAKEHGSGEFRGVRLDATPHANGAAALCRTSGGDEALC